MSFAEVLGIGSGKVRKETAEDNLILKIVSGSRAYGTEVEESDTDYRGVIIPPRNYFLGLDTFEQYESKDPDVVYYSIKKFLQLALKANPNILELVFAEDHEILDQFGKQLVDMRGQFLSQKCATTYTGYAIAQLKRLHNSTAPASRTEARMALVEKYGYDTKFGMHMVRLCRTGIEVLREGKLLVRRPDAADLLEIRHGKYTLEEMLEYGEQLLVEMKEAEAHSVLPKKPDYNYVNQRMIEIVEEYLKIKGA